MTTASAPEPAAVAAPGSLADRFVGGTYVRLVLVLGALSALGPLTIDTYLPALPTLTTELKATDAMAQLTLTGVLAGIGVGQLIIGPLSDAVGRRRPLLIGLLGHGLMSVLCALAPTVTMLAVTRTVQGLAGAAVSVVAMAMVRDLFTGIKAAQLLSRLVLVMGVAPILAPSLGGALLRFTSWRGIFVVLAIIAVGLVVLAAVALPETLPPERRLPAKLGRSLRSYRTLLSDRLFVIMVGIAGLSFATMFCYISGSPFVLQQLYGLDPQQYGLVFGIIAAGLIGVSQINPILVRRHGPVLVLRVGIGLALLGSVITLVMAATGTGGLLGLVIPLWFVIASVGLAFPNAPAIALSRHGESAGAAAALLGAAQFLVGGLAAPLVGALADGTAVPMTAMMVGTTGLALTLLLVGWRRMSAFQF
ncbi:multidrug effflux MFS transporter [Microlunatus sp. GCM10028923]|uniref:multidrug effflux MFS transporter n=1 Tax=Microlunatus sp. GCM10028923 TaxID=3273400 RepID=UPI00361956FC